MANTNDVTQKSPPDYPRLLERAQVIERGYHTMWNERMEHLDTLIADCKDADKVRQLIPRLAQVWAEHYNAKLDLERYTRLAAKQAAGSDGASKT